MVKIVDVTRTAPLEQWRVKYLSGKCYFCGKKLCESGAACLIDMAQHPASLICGECYTLINE